MKEPWRYTTANIIRPLTPRDDYEHALSMESEDRVHSTDPRYLFWWQISCHDMECFLFDSEDEGAYMATHQVITEVLAKFMEAFVDERTRP